MEITMELIRQMIEATANLVETDDEESVTIERGFDEDGVWTASVVATFTLMQDDWGDRFIGVEVVHKMSGDILMSGAPNTKDEAIDYVLAFMQEWD